MRTTWIILLCASLVPVVASAQTGGIESSSSLAAGIRQVELDKNSSKFNEYRDVGDGFNIFDLDIDVFANGSGRYFELDGQNIDREDQSLGLRAGRFGSWDLAIDWNEIPHLLSNKAQTPFINLGNGLLEVPATVPITFKKLNTSGSDAPSVVAMDELTAAYLDQFRHGVGLGLERDRGTASFTYTGFDRLGVNLTYSLQQRSGSKIGYGPIGDRPPRTLNIQIAEPIDDQTQDLELRLGHDGERFQTGFSYLYSKYDNEIDTLTWRNVFANPTPGADFDAWDRAVSVYGRRPLSSDNRMQNAGFTFGMDAPLEGRFEASASYALLEQDEELLPYSYATSNLVSAALPRTSADAEMRQTQVNLAYTFLPVSRVNVRAFYRYNDLDNQTPEDNWFYVTQDTYNLNGTRSFKNKRVSLAYDFDKQSLGFDAQTRLAFWHSSLTFAYEREEIGRAFREADTGENKLRLQWRARPSNALSLRLGYLLGDRQADDYNGFVGRLSYWYSQSEVGTDHDNPQFTFTNHPDMRRYDVSDRRRNQVDLTATFSPRETYSISASARYRDDDFDSDVRPTQPLAGRALPDQAAFTPGDQLGLLDDTRLEYSLDAAFQPSERLSWNLFATFEASDSLQRGLEFNENNKEDPSTVQTADLGPWTRASSQWTADTSDELMAFGLGLSYTVVPDRVTFRLDSTVSFGEVDITYGGFGLVNANGVPNPDNYQFAFRTPPTVTHDDYRADASVAFRVTSDLDLTVGYLFERYDLSDWQQDDGTPWYESVGSELLLRDTSRSNQWGNRLSNLGSFLAPGYDGHTIYTLFGYRF